MHKVNIITLVITATVLLLSISIFTITNNFIRREYEEQTNQMQEDIDALNEELSELSPNNMKPSDGNMCVYEGPMYTHLTTKGINHSIPEWQELFDRALIAINCLADNHSRARDMTAEQRVINAEMLANASESNYESTGLYIDPIDLAIIWRFESGLRYHVVGDNGRSCGGMQIRTDIPGRPTCDQVSDPEFAFTWAAGKLTQIQERSGFYRVDLYNGGGSGAHRYGLRFHVVRSLILRAIDGYQFDSVTYERAFQYLD